MLITLTARLKTSKSHEEELYKLFKKYSHSNNVLVKHAKKCIELLESDPEYIEIQKAYMQNKKLTKAQKLKRKELINKYGLSKNDFEKYLLKQKKTYHLHGHTTQKLAARVWAACKKYLFDKGKKIHFKKFDDFLSFENKTNNTGIIFRDNKVRIGNLLIPVYIRKNDKYILDNLNNEVHFCRITRKWHKTKWRYYVQLIVDGTPKTQTCDEGTVGIDIGPSTIAIVSDTEVRIEEIAQNVNSIESEISELDTKINEVKKLNNPDNYEPDGKIKKGHHEWVKTDEQLKLEKLRRWRFQKRHNLLEYHHNCYAKKLLRLGNIFIAEDMQFAKMAENINCGKSIGNHAPARLLKLLEWKAQIAGGIFIKVDCFKTAATQFDHTTGEFVKHDLSERVILLGNGDPLQRDIHSAFNLKYIIVINTKDGVVYKYDIEKMNLDYEIFKQKHDEVINKILQNKLEGKKVLNSIL